MDLRRACAIEKRRLTTDGKHHTPIHLNHDDSTWSELSHSREAQIDRRRQTPLSGTNQPGLEHRTLATPKATRPSQIYIVARQITPTNLSQHKPRPN